MKKKIILLLLFVIASLSGWAQSISITSISPSVQAGNTLTVGYTYTSAAACRVSCGVYLMDDWTWVSTVVWTEVNPASSGTKTGTFNVVIPAGTTPKLSLTGALNYKVQVILSNLSGGWLAGDYSVSNYNITAPLVAPPAVSFTAVPASTQVGTNLVVNYKYTSPSAGSKVAISVTKNGGANPWDYISTVSYMELDPAAAGTNVTESFTVAIPADTTPTAGLTGNQNYRVTLELKDAGGLWLAGDYNNINYIFTAAPLGLNNKNLVNGLSVYPNPVTDVLKIANADKLANASFSIVDILGKTIAKSKALNNDAIDVSNLSSGVYILSVSSEGEAKKFKFQKK